MSGMRTVSDASRPEQTRGPGGPRSAAIPTPLSSRGPFASRDRFGHASARARSTTSPGYARSCS
jgi:hypothetical protein